MEMSFGMDNWHELFEFVGIYNFCAYISVKFELLGFSLFIPSLHSNLQLLLSFSLFLLHVGVQVKICVFGG